MAVSDPREEALSFPQLESVSLPDGRRITYRYDAAGRRVARLVDGAVVERYLWADSTRLLATYDASGTLTRRFLYADARVPYAVDTPSGRYFMAYDQAGSLRVVTDAAGAVVERHETDSFGVPLSAEPTSSITGLGFAGGLTDADTGLSLFGARDYDACAGRWMAKDPIGFSGGDVNLYGYCLADPVNLVDPSGLLFGGLVNAGEAYGSQAVDYWAQRSIDPNNVWYQTAGYTAMGMLAALWTPCTSDYTTLVLAIAYEAAPVLAQTGPAIGLRIALHSAHHNFRFLGRLPHLQLNWWEIGVKGSGGALRLPIPPVGDPFFTPKDPSQESPDAAASGND